MKKRIFVMFFLLALAVGLYMATSAKTDGVKLEPPTQTPKPTQTDAPTCDVVTGYERGVVNLRACGSTSCEVIRVLTEGERLNILSAGAWAQVTTADGLKGWLNFEYCEVRP